MPTRAALSPDTAVVDTHELGYPERTAAFVVDDEAPTVVDTGLSTGTEHVLDALGALGIEPPDVEYIALTHVHMDHAGGVGELAEVCENATVLCHEFGVDFVSDPELVEKLVASVHDAVGALADDYGTMEPVPRDRVRALSGGETVDLGSRTFEVRHSPGHAPHQVAYYDPDNACLFPGDECGEWVGDVHLPSTPPPSFDYDAFTESLDAFAALEVDAIYYPHYGEHTDPDAAIETYRRRLSEWVETVETHRADHDDPADIAEALLADGHVYADLYEEWVAAELLRMNVEGVCGWLDDQ